MCGEKPFTWHLQRYIRAQWPSVRQPRMVSHKEGYYVLVFKSKEDLETVVNMGPYYMNRQPILVYKLSSDFDFVN